MADFEREALPNEAGFVAGKAHGAHDPSREFDTSCSGWVRYPHMFSNSICPPTHTVSWGELLAGHCRRSALRHTIGGRRLIVGNFELAKVVEITDRLGTELQLYAG